jgi:hypothetical protein
MKDSTTPFDAQNSHGHAAEFLQKKLSTIRTCFPKIGSPALA